MYYLFLGGRCKTWLSVGLEIKCKNLVFIFERRVFSKNKWWNRSGVAENCIKTQYPDKLYTHDIQQISHDIYVENIFFKLSTIIM